MFKAQYFIVYKPYLTLSQFSREGEKQTLKDYFDVPKNVYPVGRLDYDSEGLLLLTNDTTLNHKLLHPSFKHQREYWVQVDGSISQDAIEKIQKGVTITINGKPYPTLPCKAKLLDTHLDIAERNPPIRFRKEIPAPWVSITLTEGKNRQVRKMFAAVGFPVLRLIRVRIQDLSIQNLQPGKMLELSKQTIYQKLKL